LITAERVASHAKRALGAALCAATMLAAPAARAEPTAADRETARNLMQDGRDLRDQGDLENALTRFRAADDIMHVPTTGLEVARVEAALGMLVEARDVIASIRKTPTKPGDPEPFNEARRKADDLDASLEGRVPALTIVVDLTEPTPDPPAVTIDSVAVAGGTLGLPRSVNPGHHVILAKTSRAETRQEIDLHEWERREIHITLAAPAPPAEIAAEPEPAPEPPPRRSHGPNALTYGAIGTGGAALVVGLVTGIMSWADTSSLHGECPAHVCPPGSPSHDFDTATTLAAVSSVSFIVAGVGAGAAVASLVFVSPRPNIPRPSSARAARLAPWIGPGFAGVRGTF
jgi:hypothetical protein